MGQALLAAVGHSRGRPSYEIVFRLSQALPRTANDRVEAALEFHGRRSAPTDLASRANCYVAAIAWTGKIKAEAGARYPFALSVGSPPTAGVDGLALARHFATARQLRSVASRRLGCD